MKFHLPDFSHTLATPGPLRLQRHIADKLSGVTGAAW